MTPEERQLITGLFDRMRSYGTPQKDREAEAIISEAVRNTPDAAYMLVQSVLVQEHALQEAENRIAQLEDHVRSLQGTGQAQAPASGSFLGGLLGGGRPVSRPTTSSVPPVGSRASSPMYDQTQPRPEAQASPPPQQPAPGGFLRSAMATAAGVTGGMLAAGAIRDLLGGHANANTAANTPTTATQNAASPAGSTEPASTEKAEQDASGGDGYQDAADDDDSSWDDDGGDSDLDV